MRWLLLLCVSIACKKQAEPAPEPEQPTKPSMGYSVTKVDDPAAEPSAGTGSAAAETAVDAAAERPKYGGDGSPPHRDDDGQLHGPGGPIFMGRGPECTAEIDHCLREGVWFAVGNVVPGKLYRAVPVFEFEGKWWNFRGREESFQRLFKTKVATASELKPGSPVVWFVDENSSPKFVNSEHDALTSSRWEVGVIESVAGDKLRVLGWPSSIPLDTARVITEQKGG